MLAAKSLKQEDGPSGASRPPDQPDLNRVPSSPPPRNPSKHDLEPNPFEQSFSSKGKPDGDASSHVRRRSEGCAPLGGKSNGAGSEGAARKDEERTARAGSVASEGKKRFKTDTPTAPSPNSAVSTPKPILPPLASIASPSPAIDAAHYPWALGSGGFTGSLRSGPLSPAMLAGPQSSSLSGPGGTSGTTFMHFDPSSFRSGLTPDINGLRTGLTPLAGGPISFPPPSPNTAAFLAMVTNSSSTAPSSSATITPNTLAALTGAPGFPAPGSQHPLSISSQPQQPPAPAPDGRNDDGGNQNHFDAAFAKSTAGVFRTHRGPEWRARSEANRGEYGYHGDAAASVSDPSRQEASGRGGQMHPGPPSEQHPSQGQPVDQQHTSRPEPSADAAASGLFLLSQAHQELTKREDAAAAAAAAAQALSGVGHPPSDPSSQANNSKANRGGKGGAKPGGTKRKKGGAQEDANGTVTNRSQNGAANKKTRTRAASTASSTYPDGDGEDGEEDELGVGKEGGDAGAEGDAKKAGGASGKKLETDEEKRRNFLERNRQAALKCRQRKKAWLASLQAKVEYLQTDNDNLQNTITALREEVMHLKNLLLAHRNCPISLASAAGSLEHVPAQHPHGHPMGVMPIGISGGGMVPSEVSAVSYSGPPPPGIQPGMVHPPPGMHAQSGPIPFSHPPAPQSMGVSMPGGPPAPVHG